MLKSALRMVNVALVWVRTYLYGLSQSRKMMTPQSVHRRVDVPNNRVTLLEFVGLVFDADMILEDELKDGRWTVLDKIDKYFYENTISSLLRNYNDGPCTFQVNIVSM
jgi:hypothetical protein